MEINSLLHILKGRKRTASKQILFCMAIVSIFIETILSFILDEVSGGFYFHLSVI